MLVTNHKHKLSDESLVEFRENAGSNFIISQQIEIQGKFFILHQAKWKPHLQNFQAMNLPSIAQAGTIISKKTHVNTWTTTVLSVLTQVSLGLSCLHFYLN